MPKYLNPLWVLLKNCSCLMLKESVKTGGWDLNLKVDRGAFLDFHGELTLIHSEPAPEGSY